MPRYNFYQFLKKHFGIESMPFENIFNIVSELNCQLYGLTEEETYLPAGKDCGGKHELISSLQTATESVYLSYTADLLKLKCWI